MTGWMTKMAAVMAAAVLVAGVAGCGQATKTKTTTVVAQAAPAPTSDAASAVDSDGNHVATLPDMALCGAVRDDWKALIVEWRHLPASDSAEVAFVQHTLQPRVQRILNELNPVLDKANTASDKRRLGQMQTGLATVNGGLQAAVDGDYSATSMVDQGFGQVSAAIGTTALDVCGGGSN